MDLTVQELRPLNLAHYDEAFIESCILKRMEALRCDDWDHYLRMLEQQEAEKQALQRSLQVSFSSFFRNPLTFTVLEYLVLPDLLQRNGKMGKTPLRCWSMACAAGQEIYSLAILLEEYAQKKQLRLNHQLFGSDANVQVIDAAKKGWYEKENLENVTFKRLGQWFIQENDGYRLIDAIREKVHFSDFDLVSDPRACPSESIYGEFDLVFCSNVLFYFQKDVQKLLLDKASAVLSKKGYLVTGEVERHILQRNGFHEVHPHTGIFRTTDKR